MIQIFFLKQKYKRTFQYCKPGTMFQYLHRLMQTNYHDIKIRPNIPYSIKFNKENKKNSLTTSIAVHKQ